MELENHSLRPYPNEVWKYDGTLQDAHKMLAWVYERKGFGKVGLDSYARLENPEEVLVYNEAGGTPLRVRPNYYVILNLENRFFVANQRDFEKHYEPHTTNKDVDTEPTTTE